MTRLLLAIALLLPATAQPVPLCLPDATAVALVHLGTPTDAGTLARDLPVHTDGVDLFDLRLWLADHGHPATVLPPDQALVQRLVGAGWPVVLVRTEPRGRHAVALLPGPKGHVVVVDGPQAARQTQPWAQALARMHAGLVLWRPPATPARAVGARRWQEVLRLDAEFLATGWLRRAREHRQPSEAQLALAARAVAAAPCYRPARQMVADVTARLPASEFVRRTVAALPRCAGSGPTR